MISPEITNNVRIFLDNLSFNLHSVSTSHSLTGDYIIIPG